MVSQTAEYALRAVLYLARSGRPLVPAEAIAVGLGAPANYMSKTLHQLAKAGIVEGVRGPTGGFRLAIDPSVLTVARIIETFDSVRSQPVCLLGDRLCDAANPCQAHHRWTAVTSAMRRPLTQTTLRDLMDETESTVGQPSA